MAYKNLLDKAEDMDLLEGTNAYREMASRLESYASDMAKNCHELPPSSRKRLSELGRARFSNGYEGMPLKDKDVSLLSSGVLAKLAENFSISGTFEFEGRNFKMTVELFREPVFYRQK